MATIVSTMGPRGYKAKYGVTSDGTVVELYTGPLIKETGGSSSTYNYEFINLSDDDLPFFMTNQNPYTGTTDAERVAWLQDQMKKMEVVAQIYASKIKDISTGEPELSTVVANSLVLVGGKLLTTVPVAGIAIAGVGLIIKFLSSSTNKKILEFKKTKILQWAAVIKVLQDQYIVYNDEITSIRNKKIFLIVAVLGIGFYFYKKNHGKYN